MTDYHYKTHPDVLQKFEEAGIKVIVVGSATSFEDIYSNIEMIGDGYRKQEEAKEIITDMKDRLQVNQRQSSSRSQIKRKFG